MIGWMNVHKLNFIIECLFSRRLPRILGKPKCVDCVQCVQEIGIQRIKGMVVIDFGKERRDRW